MDPLYDPDDEDLLHPRQARELADRIEAARLSSGAVRYGRLGRVGVASVVINRDSPLPASNHACGLWGTSAEVATTLLSLEQTFADVGRAEAVVFASPTTVSEIEGIADDAGWRAVEELAVMVCQEDRAGGTPTRPARDSDLREVAEFIADDAGLSGEGERRLVRHIGHRLDDPRCVLRVAEDNDYSGSEGQRLAGFAAGFAEHGTGLVEQIMVRPGRRRRGIGRSLVGDVLSELRGRGAVLLAGCVEQGGSAERFAQACGFETAYEVTAYARRVDELVD